MKRPQPQPPHTQGTFYRRLQPLYTEKHQVSCSGCLPQNKPHATVTQPLQYVLQHHVYNPHVSTHMATNHDKNHAAITLRSAVRDCQRFNKRIERRTYKQPHVAEHQGRTDSTLKRPQPQPPHTQGTFHRRLQPLYTEKHKVSCSGCLPKNKPHATFMQPSQCVLQHHVSNPHVSTHKATHHDKNHAAITAICSQRLSEIQQAHRTMHT